MLPGTPGLGALVNHAASMLPPREAAATWSSGVLQNTPVSSQGAKSETCLSAQQARVRQRIFK
jgi:hypothetical protein